jgi:hypothetical protein
MDPDPDHLESRQQRLNNCDYNNKKHRADNVFRYELLFLPIFRDLQNGGSKRNPSIPTESIKAGLPKPDGDMKGVDIEKRMLEWREKREQRHAFVVTFFRPTFPKQPIDLIEQYHTGISLADKKGLSF